MHEVKESGMTSAGRENARLGLGVFTYSGVVEEVRQNGLGYAERSRITELNDLVAAHLLARDVPKPEVDQVFTNRFAGKMKLTTEQWNEAVKQRAEFAKYFD
jgi:hypothetical protein